MNKKSIVISFAMLVIFIAGTFLYAREEGRRAGNSDLQLSKSSGQPRSTRLNINNMSHWFRADLWSARDPRTGNSGVIFPRGISEQLAVIFTDGLVWGGQVQDGASPALRVGGAQYAIGTIEGAITAPGVAENPDAADVRIYRIRRDYNSADLFLDAQELALDVATVRAQYASDWAEWPWQKGAPWTGIDNELDGGYLGADGTTVMGAGNGVLDRGEDANSNGILDAGEDANGNEALDGEVPGIAGGDQVVWTVANDLNASFTVFGSPPIGLEVQLTAWGYQRTDALGNMIFKQFKVIYKGTATTPPDAVVDPMYLVQWSDPDLGTYTDDFVGVDPELSLAYVYNSTSVDPTYAGFGFPPPASGYDFFQGVLVPGDPEDVGTFNFQPRPGFKNLPMTFFGYFAAGASFTDPGPLGSYEATIEWWNLFRGFLPQSDPADPQPYVDNVTGQPTLFPLSGDPVTQTGDLDGVVLPPGDRRLLMVTGPFTFALGDTQEVVISLIAAIGSDRLSSVAVLRFFDKTAQSTFDNVFKVVSPPAGPVVKATGLDNEIVLDWGFDAAAVATTEGQDASGYLFEGYNVYQLAGASPDLGSAIKLATFDLINENTTVLSEVFDTNSGVIVQSPVQVGTNSGIKRFFTITKDAFRDRPLANDQDYYFAVTAYNATTDLSQTDRALESTPVVIRVRAHSPTPGVRLNTATGSDVDVTRSAGVSDGSITVTVVDPDAVTGHDYEVSFAEDTTLGIVWNLTDVTTGETVLANQAKQTTDAADLDFATVDGLVIQVFGAPPDYKRTPGGSPAIIEVANEAGPLPPESYDDNGAPFGGNDVYHSLNAGGFADRYFISYSGNGNTPSSGAGRVDFSVFVPFDFELRFTDVADGQWGWWAFSTGNVAKVPFRLWNVGIATFDDPSDDIELIPIMFSGAGTDDAYTPDHGPDGAFGFPSFDRIYWYNGDAAAHEAEADATGAISQDYTTTEVFGRMLVADFDGNGLPPAPGTVIRIFSTKPHGTNDVFAFSTSDLVQTQSSALAKQDALDQVGVFPNPYLGVNRLETTSQNRFVRFNHLPANTKIRIFNLAGTLLKTLTDQSDQYMDWDLQNEAGLPAASGIYLAHVEMPGIGQKILKLMLIQEQQFLRTF